MDPHYYHVNVAWSTDRKGMMCSPELNQTTLGSTGCIEVATPPEFPKGIPGIWSPEHLFTASVSSCLMTTFLAIAENSQLDFLTFDCQAEGKLERFEGKFLMTEVVLRPIVTVRNEKDIDKALTILQKSEDNCLISRSVRSKITMIPRVSVAGLKLVPA